MSERGPWYGAETRSLTLGVRSIQLFTHHVHRLQLPMRVVIQRVSRACVVVDGNVVGEIGRGLLALIGIEASDPSDPAAKLPEKFADKLVNLRIFEDHAGKMNLSVNDLAASAAATPSHPGLLLIPNFTVAGDASKGRRPSFDTAMRPEHAEPMFQRIVQAVRSAASPVVHVATGVFRAHMEVTLTNDGPVTVVLEIGREGARKFSTDG